MNRYLECRATDGSRVMIKLDAIRSFWQDDEDTVRVETTSHDDYHTLDMTFDRLKQLIEADDHRCVVDDSWPPALLWLARNRVVDHVKMLGPQLALEMLYKIISTCDTEVECQKVYDSFTQCPDCEGYGFDRSERGDVPCAACDGDGRRRHAGA